ncbi:putative exonuclease [Handroanthus impetiginosus]|uniref:Putative exonuclease n=1 Tax=Handroanthus impetiginosus TaxID=429701 RepID=A0A2G9GUZ4_9LAMI|nr:putative exonuclease [Handroanthus impetiginosus]
MDEEGSPSSNLNSSLNPAAVPYHPLRNSSSSVNFASQNPYYSNPNLARNNEFPQRYHHHHHHHHHHPYGHNQNFQDFDKFVVMDFEATCDEGKRINPIQEIIEFPSVIVDGRTGQLEDCFQTYVRPTINGVLTDYCKDLTGIQQTQVDKGVSLSVALDEHDKWLESKGIKNSKFSVVTWGDWDCRTMLESECRHKNIPKAPYFNRWINLKVPYSVVFGGAKTSNLEVAVENAGLTWEGRPHCGLDDAKNTARLLALIMQKGFKLSFTRELHTDSLHLPENIFNG